MGGGLEGSLQNLRWGTAHAFVLQYFEKYSVIGCAAKYELTKNMCHKGMFCCETEVFVKKRVIYCNEISESRDGHDRQKIDKIRSMT